MKNSLKIGALAIVVTGSLVACDPPAGDSGTKKPEIDSPQSKIDTAQKKGIDSTKKDSVKK